MKGLAFLIIKVMLIIAAISGILYSFNIPITEVAGERIGFADLINFFVLQFPPGLQERDAKDNAETAAWVSKIDGSDLGEAAATLSRLGNPIKFCIFRDYNYCQNFRLEGGKIRETTEAAQKTVYISYEFSLELKARAETKNFEGLEKRLVQGIKNGEIKGLAITDMMALGK